jgi:predicted Zn-dependent protease with MMP-like domain
MLFKCTIEYLSEGAGLSERASTELPSLPIRVVFQNTALIDHFNGPISLGLF